MDWRESREQQEDCSLETVGVGTVRDDCDPNTEAALMV